MPDSSLQERPFVAFLSDLSKLVEKEAERQDLGKVQANLVEVGDHCLAMELQFKDADEGVENSPWRLFAAGCFRKMGYNGGETQSLVKLQQVGSKKYIHLTPDPLAILAIISIE